MNTKKYPLVATQPRNSGHSQKIIHQDHTPVAFCVVIQVFTTLTLEQLVGMEGNFPFLPSSNSHLKINTSENHYLAFNCGILFNKQQVQVSPLNSDVLEHSAELMSLALANENEGVMCS